MKSRLISQMQSKKDSEIKVTKLLKTHQKKMQSFHNKKQMIRINYAIENKDKNDELQNFNQGKNIIKRHHFDSNLHLINNDFSKNEITSVRANKQNNKKKFFYKSDKYVNNDKKQKKCITERSLQTYLKRSREDLFTQQQTSTLKNQQKLNTLNQEIFYAQNINKVKQTKSIKQQNKQVDNLLFNCHSGMWKLFLIEVGKIKKLKQKQWQGNSVLTLEEKKNKLIVQNMKLMKYLIEQQQNKISDTFFKFQNLQSQDLKQLYFNSHELHSKFMTIKKVIQEHNHQYQRYLLKLKQQQKQRRQSLQSKRNLNSTAKSNSIKSLSLKFLNQNTIQDQTIKQVMEKKSKLNLELDLSFQIQQRKKIAKQKQSFNQKKAKLQKQKQIISVKIKQIKQKTQLKQKDYQIYSNQKEKLQKQRQFFLKSLLKNQQYRNDGILWVFQNMIECCCEPILSDFPNNLDDNGRLYLLKQFERIKSQGSFQVKPIKRKIVKQVRKHVKRQNRQRVKSMILVPKQFSNSSTINIDQREEQGYFSFGNRINQKNKLSIRKKSGSVIVPKLPISFQQIFTEGDRYSQKNDGIQGSLKVITKESNRKKIYESAKTYIKSWINRQGWKSQTARNIQKPVQQKISQHLKSQQKSRLKQRFFKIGRANTKYNSMMKTLFGNQQFGSVMRRVKTSR